MANAGAGERRGVGEETLVLEVVVARRDGSSVAVRGELALNEFHCDRLVETISRMPVREKVELRRAQR